MNRFISYVLAMAYLAIVGISNAQSKEQNEYSYIKMPSGKYYQIPREKESLGAETVNCIAYSKYPDSYYNIKPWYCTGFNAAAAFRDITINTGKNPAKIIIFTNGQEISNNGGLQGEKLLCKVKTDFPIEFKGYSEYFNLEATCNPLSVNIGAAVSDTASNLVLRLSAAAALFALMTIGLWGKSRRDTLLKQGRWFGAIGGFIAIAVVSQGTRNVTDYLFILSINIVVYITIGLLCGMIWFKVTESPKAISDDLIADENSTKADVSITKDHEPAFPSNTHWENALRELETGSRDELLWAKCVVACNGDLINAKAEYLKLRVIQLAETKDA